MVGGPSPSPAASMATSSEARSRGERGRPQDPSSSASSSSARLPPRSNGLSRREPAGPRRRGSTPEARASPEYSPLGWTTQAWSQRYVRRQKEDLMKALIIPSHSPIQYIQQF